MERLNMDESIFSMYFGKDWSKLDEALQRFYGLNKTIISLTYRGNFTVKYRWYMKLIKLSSFIMRTTFPTADKNITMQGPIEATKNSTIFKFNRTYTYESRREIRLQSNWQLLPKEKCIIEYSGKRVGWKFFFTVKDDKTIELNHKAWVMKIGTFVFELPLASWFVGKGHAVQTANGDNQFDLKMNLSHPFCKKYYTYEGFMTIVATSKKME